MTSKDYWAKRSALDMARYMRTAEQTAELMEQAGKAAADYVNSLIKGVFTGFEGFGISETEARNILSAGNNRTALQRLRAAASRVADPKKRQALTDAINSAGAYRYRIDRLEEIGRQISEQCNSLYKTQLGAVRSCLGGVASEAYYRTIFDIQQRTGLGFSFALFPKSQVEQLLSKHWCGASYSQRLWRDTDILADRLKDELLIGLLSGRSGEKTARVIREQFGNNTYCARRLVRTESSYISGQAAMQGYDEAGIEKYIFLATLREATCDICAELDGQRFSRSEAKPGENMHPMHPNCACSTIADTSPEELHKMERRAKDKDGNTVTVPADMTYKQWRENFVDGNKVLTNGAGDGIMKAGSDRVALEFQRYGRNKSTLVNKTYIDGGEYRRKFDNATDNPEVNKTLYDSAKRALKHRSGTELEDMYWLDGATGRIIAKEINSTTARQVNYSSATKDAVNSYTKNRIIALHTHPSSMPPSVEDLNACYNHGYKCGYIACHNGKVFGYSSGQLINTKLYELYVGDYIDGGLSEFDAQWKALEDLKRNHKIDFWEVK